MLVHLVGILVVDGIAEDDLVVLILNGHLESCGSTGPLDSEIEFATRELQILHIVCRSCVHEEGSQLHIAINQDSARCRGEIVAPVGEDISLVGNGLDIHVFASLVA